MKLNLADENITADQRFIAGDRVKLVITYPAASEFRIAILEAFAKLLRPRTEPLCCCDHKEPVNAVQ